MDLFVTNHPAFSVFFLIILFLLFLAIMDAVCEIIINKPRRDNDEFNDD